MKHLFTIGHSSHTMAAFLEMLEAHSIQVVVDVRSAPYSKYVPQFNKSEVEKAIIAAGFKYIFMGDAIGGKPTDPEFLEASGGVSYEKIASSEKFLQGMERLEKGINDGWIIALMCAEEDPLKCHRHLLIARELELRRNISVRHIRSDGGQVWAGEYFTVQPEQQKLF
jgi:uncharacterized protein (DUF488 family)